MESTDVLGTLLDMGAGSHAESKTATRLSPVYATGLAIAMIFIGVLTGYALAKRLNLSDELASRAREAAAGPFVQIAVAVRGAQDRLIKALGESRPFISVTLYAKISGYLRSISVDKGDRVKKGQLLATIDAPETNSQYAGALASSKNRRAISNRTSRLHRQKVVTDEEAEQATAAADVATARLSELEAQRSYAQIQAPFDGVVTARFADPGALMQNAANAQSGAQPIVTVSQTERLRVTIFVDQREAPFVKIGDPAEISIAERPEARYAAVVTRIAGELDSRSRTMLTEIELDNAKDEIVAGSFVDVTLKVRTPSVIQVPSEALIMKGNKASVMVVNHDGIVHSRDVQVGDNDGTKINVLSGLEEDAVVVLNQGNNLIEGQHVQN